MTTHLINAENKIDESIKDYYERDEYKISFEIQSDPIAEVGVNGLQATDMLVYVKDLFKSLNDVFPCRENSLTITKLEEAIHWQDARTQDREKRGVEGYNKE